jgi:FlaA1/EpsC-like NDP-sugar epimerase
LRRFLPGAIREIQFVSRDEKGQDYMRHLYGEKKLYFYIGDVRNALNLGDAMSGADIVFSAAAFTPFEYFVVSEHREECVDLGLFAEMADLFDGVAETYDQQ